MSNSLRLLTLILCGAAMASCSRGQPPASACESAQCQECCKNGEPTPSDSTDGGTGCGTNCTKGTGGGGGGAGASDDWGAEFRFDEIVGLTSGAAYSIGQSLDKDVEVALSESRAFVINLDGGITIVERPAHPETRFLNSISKDLKYFYSNSDVWRVSDGQHIFSATGLGVINLVGESSSGALILVSSEYDQRLNQVVVVPLDGSPYRLVGISDSRKAVLLPGDLLLFGNDEGLWLADLKISEEPKRIDASLVQSVGAIPNRAIALISTQDKYYWLDLEASNSPETYSTNDGTPVITDTGKIGFIRVDSDLRTVKLKLSKDSIEQTAWTTSEPNQGLGLGYDGIAFWTETKNSVPQYFMAEIKIPFEPIALPSQSYHRIQKIKGTRRGHILFQDNGKGMGVLEFDFSTQTASEVWWLGPQAVIHGQAVIFIDATSKHLMIKPFGQEARELSQQPCALLSDRSQMALHQCDDHALYMVDVADHQVHIAGAEVSDDEYAFASSGDLIRYVEVGIRKNARYLNAVRAWLYEVGTKTVLLNETERSTFGYSFGAGKFVRVVGEDESARVALFDPTTRTDTVFPVQLANVNPWLRPSERDGGAHILLEETTSDGGRYPRLLDMATKSFVPVGDGGVYQFRRALGLDRYAGIVSDSDGKSYLVESTTGHVRPVPSLSDGGSEDGFLSELPSAAGATRYSGDWGIYDDNLRPLIEFSGSKRTVVDRDSGTAYCVSDQYLSDGGNDKHIVALFVDGGVGSVQPFLPMVNLDNVFAEKREEFFVLREPNTDGGYTFSTYRPSTQSLVVRHQSAFASYQAIPGGFLVDDIVDGKSTKIIIRFDQPSAQRLNQESETILRVVSNTESRRIALRSTTGTWRDVSLSVIDLDTMSRRVIVRSDATTKLGAFTFSADGSKLVFTTSTWDGTRSNAWVTPL